MLRLFKRHLSYKEPASLKYSFPSDEKDEPVARLGPYCLVRILGKGGMASVWVGSRDATHEISKTVAIKVIDPQLAANEHYQTMFFEEAKLSMKLSHSNIAQVFDVGREGNQSYLVMEWVDGTNLSNLCKLLYKHSIRLPIEVIGYLMGEVLRALMYAHQITDRGAPMGIVHRDVSPQNVLISVSGEVKLTDFGIARVASNETSGRLIKGKIRYMSPEQFSGNSKAPTVDLYAVGAMLHELLDAERFRGDFLDDRALGAQVMTGVIPDLRFPNKVPDELNQLRLALLAPDVEQRVSSAEKAFDMLRKWPGYHNAAPELAHLCRMCTGVTFPRSIVGYTSHGCAIDDPSLPYEQQKALWIHRTLASYARTLKPEKLKQPATEVQKPAKQEMASAVVDASSEVDPDATTKAYPKSLPNKCIPVPAPPAKADPSTIPTRTMTLQMPVQQLVRQQPQLPTMHLRRMAENEMGIDKREGTYFIPVPDKPKPPPQVAKFAGAKDKTREIQRKRSKSKSRRTFYTFFPWILMAISLSYLIGAGLSYYFHPLPQRTQPSVRLLETATPSEQTEPARVSATKAKATP